MKKILILSLILTSLIALACEGTAKKYENPPQNFEGFSTRSGSESSHTVPE